MYFLSSQTLPDDQPISASKALLPNNLDDLYNSSYITKFLIVKYSKLKMTVFCDVVPCSLVEVYRRGGDDGGSKHL
jgi:hypothetical protein